MRKSWVVVPMAMVLAACGGSGGGGGETSPSPSASPTPTTMATTRPAKAISYTSGTAEVTVDGATQTVFSAPLDPSESSTFAPDDGFDVWWRTGDQALNISGDLKSGEVDAFIRVETAPGNANAYVDSWHTICDITITEFTDTALSGSYSCPDLPSFDGKTKIDTTGTFSATG